LLDGAGIGVVTTYDYETPWACGCFEPTVGSVGEAARAYTELDAWSEVHADASDAEYEAMSRSLGLPADGRSTVLATLVLIDADGVARDATLFRVDEHDIAEWRWEASLRGG
jgi:hypothetical protein